MTEAINYIIDFFTPKRKRTGKLPEYVPPPMPKKITEFTMDSVSLLPDGTHAISGRIMKYVFPVCISIYGETDTLDLYLDVTPGEFENLSRVSELSRQVSASGEPIIKIVKRS